MKESLNNVPSVSDDPKVPESVPEQEQNNGQDLTSKTASKPDVVVLPSRRSLYPKIDGLGPTTDAYSVQR